MTANGRAALPAAARLLSLRGGLVVAGVISKDALVAHAYSTPAALFP